MTAAINTHTPSATYGMSVAEAAEILFPKPSFEASADGAELVRQMQRAVGDYLDAATIKWLTEETLYQAALLTTKLSRPLDVGYIGTVTIVRSEVMPA
jgi:hypothetical protein